MNNALVVTVFNSTPAQHTLTVLAITSALAQDIPIDLFILNNGSTYQPTRNWLDALAENVGNVTVEHYGENMSPVKLCNMWMTELFGRGYSHLLGIPNDVILPGNLYREFLKWPRGIVTGSMTTEREFPKFETTSAINECTPMAVALIRCWAWEALMVKDGFFFDPRFHFYASDCDLALRIAACGIHGVQIDLQYWHHGSASHRLTRPENVAAMAHGADLDRVGFVEKWGFAVFDPLYQESARDINFKGEGNG